MHITDWLPTLITAAGGNSSDISGNIDGMDQWQSLVHDGPFLRNEVLYNIDPHGFPDKNAGIRYTMEYGV